MLTSISSSSHWLVTMVCTAESTDTLRQHCHMQEHEFGEESPPVDRLFFSSSSSLLLVLPAHKLKKTSVDKEDNKGNQ